MPTDLHWNDLPNNDDESMFCLRCEQRPAGIDVRICHVCRAELADGDPDGNWQAAYVREEHAILKQRLQTDPGYAPRVVCELNEMIEQYAADNFITTHLKTARDNFMTRVTAIQEELRVAT